MVLVLQNINEFGDSGNKRLVSVLSVQKFLWEQVNNMDFFFFKPFKRSKVSQK